MDFSDCNVTDTEQSGEMEGNLAPTFSLFSSCSCIRYVNHLEVKTMLKERGRR